jgi:FKBP-type peptidyl-prolyl cis-trans isomerase
MITDIKKGNGAVVEENNTVIVQYTGILWDQKTVFDSTWESGTPASFPAGPNQGLIPGFSEALVGHTVGSQVIAVIPPDLGYGTKGIPQAGIPGNATLIFVVDILGTA